MNAPIKYRFPRTVEGLVFYVVLQPKMTLNVLLKIGTEAQEP